jgi:hypothetical protein
MIDSKFLLDLGGLDSLSILAEVSNEVDNLRSGKGVTHTQSLTDSIANFFGLSGPAEPESTDSTVSSRDRRTALTLTASSSSAIGSVVGKYRGGSKSSAARTEITVRQRPSTLPCFSS